MNSSQSAFSTEMTCSTERLLLEGNSVPHSRSTLSTEKVSSTESSLLEWSIMQAKDQSSPVHTRTTKNQLDSTEEDSSTEFTLWSKWFPQCVVNDSWAPEAQRTSHEAPALAPSSPHFIPSIDAGKYVCTSHSYGTCIHTMSRKLVRAMLVVAMLSLLLLDVSAVAENELHNACERQRNLLNLGDKGRMIEGKGTKLCRSSLLKYYTALQTVNSDAKNLTTVSNYSSPKLLKLTKI